MLVGLGGCASEAATDVGADPNPPPGTSAGSSPAGGADGADGLAGEAAEVIDASVAVAPARDVDADTGADPAPTGPLDAGTAAPTPEPDAAQPPWTVPDGGASSFPAAFYLGLWHVGWTGGLSHHSWVRFHPDSNGLEGRWETAPTRCPLCEGYFRCEGADGSFSVDVATETIHLTMPSSCDPQLQTEQSWTIRSFGDPELQLEPLGSDLKAYFLANGTSNTSASRMPDDYCADLYDCTDAWFDPDL